MSSGPKAAADEFEASEEGRAHRAWQEKVSLLYSKILTLPASSLTVGQLLRVSALSRQYAGFDYHGCERLAQELGVEA